MDRGQTGRRAARSQARAALAGPLKRGPGRVFVALWARAPALWARGCPPGPLSHGAYKNPPGVLKKGRSRV